MLIFLYLCSYRVRTIELIRKECVMKKLMLLIFSLIFVSYVSAQEFVEKRGKLYKDNKPFTGVVVEKYDNGNLKAEKSYLKGLLDGTSTFYYENGLKKEQRSYKKGHKDGTWVTWNEDQVKTGEAGYKNGLKHGYWYLWDKEGNKRYELYYVMGEKQGDWIMWDESGNVALEKHYAD